MFFLNATKSAAFVCLHNSTAHCPVPVRCHSHNCCWHKSGLSKSLAPVWCCAIYDVAQFAPNRASSNQLPDDVSFIRNCIIPEPDYFPSMFPALGMYFWVPGISISVFVFDRTCTSECLVDVTLCSSAFSSWHGIALQKILWGISENQLFGVFVLCPFSWSLYSCMKKKYLYFQDRIWFSKEISTMFPTVIIH